MTKEKVRRFIALSLEWVNAGRFWDGQKEYDALKAEFEAWNPSKDMAGHRILLNQRDEARRLLVSYLKGPHTSFEEPEATYRQRFLLENPQVEDWMKENE